MTWEWIALIWVAGLLLYLFRTPMAIAAVLLLSACIMLIAMAMEATKR
jgi:hypothetical protein